MAHKVDAPLPVVLGLIGAVVAAPYLMQPAEFRRSLALEAKGLVGMTPRYEVMYEQCADPNQNNDPLSAKGFAKGFAGGLGHTFPAIDDADAKAFAASVRPACKVDVLYRVKRVRRGGKLRRDRERIYM